MTDEFDWLDLRTGEHTGLENRAEIMRDGAMLGKDRIWWTDGEYVWFRRSKSNPATLQRHNKFVAAGDYRHVETQNGIEIYQLQPSSPFKAKGKQIDIGKMDNYNVRRQAALAAVRRDWPAFRDVMTFLRERVNAKHVANPAMAEAEYAELYMAIMESIQQRQGPAPNEITREMFALAQNSGELRNRMITIGGA